MTANSVELQQQIIATAAERRIKHRQATTGDQTPKEFSRSPYFRKPLPPKDWNYELIRTDAAVLADAFCAVYQQRPALCLQLATIHSPLPTQPEVTP